MLLFEPVGFRKPWFPVPFCPVYVAVVPDRRYKYVAENAVMF